ncbi:restriction endonuclease subunit S [Flagellimonas sp.]|uniref:restriction endonuclease subunit S n=1 Tax=Flagellimonas sp. TaxID=2058762 RepID=UPI003BA84FA2
MKKGWTEKVWDEVLEIRSGRNQKQVEDSNGKFPIIGSAGKIMGYASDYICEEGTTIIGRKGTINNPMLIKEKFWNVDTAFGLHAKDSLDKRFLHYFCLSFDFTEMDRGSGRPSLVKSDLLKIKMLVPPLPEQQRIVSILDQAFAAIDKAKANAEKNLQNVKELLESYLQEVFENKDDGWETATLGDVCSLYQGIAINAKTKHALVEKSELPLLRIKDLKNNTEEQYIDPKSFPKNALVNEDDIIYTRTGSLGLVFRGRKGVLHNNSFKVIPNSKLDKDYLFIWLQNPIFKSKILHLALRAAQPDITHKIFKIQEISFPSIEEQKSMVEQLDALRSETEKLEAVYKKKMDDLEELKKSILQKAFAGEFDTSKSITNIENKLRYE